MTLHGHPYIPSVADLHNNGRLFPPNFLHESWLDFLYWDNRTRPLIGRSRAPPHERLPRRRHAAGDLGGRRRAAEVVALQFLHPASFR